MTFLTASGEPVNSVGEFVIFSGPYFVKNFFLPGHVDLHPFVGTVKVLGQPNTHVYLGGEIKFTTGLTGGEETVVPLAIRS
jgi:hypothetical protein